MFSRNINFIKEGYRNAFSITMENYTINPRTGVEEVSGMKSIYHREIYSVPWTNIGYTRYILDETLYKPTNNDNFMKWNFAKGAEFYGCLYQLTDTEEKERLYKEAELAPPFPNLEESFEKFPKLPSVYLVIMQAIDIITFDAFLCMVNSNMPTARFSTDYTIIKDMLNRNIDMGSGRYSEESYYFNSSLYTRFVGKSMYKGIDCWVVRYNSDPSEVFMKDNKIKNQKKSKSLYSGLIYICCETGEILHGELDEDIITISKTNKYTKRRAILKGGE